MGAEFIDYDKENGVWTFKVNHFSRYSINGLEVEEPAKRRRSSIKNDSVDIPINFVSRVDNSSGRPSKVPRFTSDVLKVKSQYLETLRHKVIPKQNSSSKDGFPMVSFGSNDAEKLLGCFAQIAEEEDSSQDLARFWKLANVLWGSSENQFRDAINWAISNEPENCRSSMESLFEALCFCDTARAAEIAYKINRPRLGMMIACCTQAKELKSDIRDVLLCWKGHETKESLSPDLLKVYHVLAGDVDDPIVQKGLNDWLSYFGLCLLASAADETPLKVVITKFLKSGGKLYERCGKKDICFELLKVYSKSSATGTSDNIATVFSSALSLLEQSSLQSAWLLVTLLQRLLHCDSPRYSEMTKKFVEQLTEQKRYIEAIYVSLFLTPVCNLDHFYFILFYLYSF